MSLKHASKQKENQGGNNSRWSKWVCVSSVCPAPVVESQRITIAFSTSLRLIQIHSNPILQLLPLTILGQELQSKPHRLDGRGIIRQRQKVRSGHSRTIDSLRLLGQSGIGFARREGLLVLGLDIFDWQRNPRVLVVLVHFDSVVGE